MSVVTKQRPDAEKIARIVRHHAELGERFPRFAIFIVAYAAMDRLVQVLQRIPPEIYEVIEEIFIFDDFSPDETYDICRAYLDREQLPKVSLYRNPHNYGYGGNQKLGYEYAIAKGYDYVILLHGDGQYAPEALPDLMLPTLEQAAEIVFGSRMMTAGAARAGGMPLYKLLGNKILTRFENALLGLELTEFHSGYRLYSTCFLRRVHYRLNTDDFHFDTQIIIQARQAGCRIVEVPIPTYYGDEICHVNGMRYAANVAATVVDYRLHQLGINHEERYELADRAEYVLKDFHGSSHRVIAEMVPKGSRVLDIGCGRGLFAAKLVERDCTVVGVDLLRPEDVEGPLEQYYQRNLWESLDLPVARDFDVVVLADVLEHVPDPERLLAEARRHLREGGHVIVSVPNIGLWVYRLALFAGRFDYTTRGVMDRTHLRFFTRKSARHLLLGAQFTVTEEHASSIPFQLLVKAPGGRAIAEAFTRGYTVATSLWPKGLAYQFIFKAQARRPDWRDLRAVPLAMRDQEPHPHLSAVEDGGLTRLTHPVSNAFSAGKAKN